MSQTATIPRPFSRHPVALQRAAEVFNFLTLKLWYDTTIGLWELWEKNTSGPLTQFGSLVSSGLTDEQASDAIVVMMMAKRTRPDARPADQITIQEHIAQLCREYKELFETLGKSDEPVTEDEERHTAIVMHMVMPLLARRIGTMLDVESRVHASVERHGHNRKLDRPRRFERPNLRLKSLWRDARASGGFMVKPLPKGTPEYFDEQARCAELMLEWKDHPHDEEVEGRLRYSLEKLGLIVPGDSH